jgi:hypothetical protein
MTAPELLAVDALKRANRSILSAGLALATERGKLDPALVRLRGLVGQVNALREAIEQGPVGEAHRAAHSKVAG